MFSRTTMASSINSPMASDSPISVSMFRVNPRRVMTMNVLITDTGSASPVITVLRQLFRKRNTIRTVRNAADQQRVLHVLHRIANKRRAVHHRAQADVRRQFPVQVSSMAASMAVGDVHGVGAGLLDHVERQPGLPSSSAALRRSSIPSTMRATSER